LVTRSVSVRLSAVMMKPLIETTVAKSITRGFGCGRTVTGCVAPTTKAGTG
jgi:hypothetical protein